MRETAMRRVEDGPWVVHEWEDLWTGARVRVTGGINAEFELFEMVAIGDRPEYQGKGTDNPADRRVTDLSDAQPFLTGWAKWDGCVEFDIEERHHVCSGWHGIRQFTNALHRVIATARAAMPEPDERMWYLEEAP